MSSTRAELVREDTVQAMVQHTGDLAPIRNAHILITGGTGFVGTWLTEAITYLNDVHKFGARITLLARNTARLRETAPHLARRKDVALVDSDVRNIRGFDNDVSWIVHAGSTPDNRVYTTDGIKAADTIISGTRAVLDAAIRLPELNGLLHLSSGYVYGPQPAADPQATETSFNGFDSSAVTSVYAESKRIAETLCATYANQHRIRIVHARPYAFIGPYQLLDRPWAINNFIRDGLRGGPIRILGDGATVRSYMYAADMSAWLLTMLVRGQSGMSYNIGSPEGVKLADVAQMVADQMSPTPRVSLPIAGNRTTASTFVPSTARAEEKLGLTPVFDVVSAIRRTVQWHKL
ncbi:MAG TPA: NAD-dependent epimerase/dehydratase family protein [Capsulimonadaceae bacterium]|jgi:dTDP-glucose 4,6-dehydratase